MEAEDYARGEGAPDIIMSEQNFEELLIGQGKDDPKELNHLSTSRIVHLAEAVGVAVAEAP